MSNYLSEQLAVCGVQVPVVSAAAADTNTEVIDMTKFNQVMFVLVLGAATATGDANFKIQQSILGTSTWVDLTGAAITSLDDNNDNEVAVICVRADSLTDGYRYIRGNLVVDDDTVATCVVAVGQVAQGVASALDVAAASGTGGSVVQIVNV